jgi:hypothetical protein
MKPTRVTQDWLLKLEGLGLGDLPMGDSEGLVIQSS